MTHQTLGRYQPHDGSQWTGYCGYFSEWATWATVLTDEEIESLALGFSPQLVRPEWILSHWPLQGVVAPETDRRGYYPLNLPAGGGWGWSPPTFNFTAPKTTYVPIRLPTVPHDPTPLTDAINQRAPITLTWIAEGADLYDVYFAANGDNVAWSTPAVQNLTSPAWSPQRLQAGVMYAWLVVAKNEAGNVNGPAWYFSMTPKPTEEPDLPVEGTLVTWVEFVDSTGGLHVWSGVALADPPAYFGGYKEPRVVETGQLTRALSDIGGTYQGADFSVTLSDADHALRKLLADNATKYFVNRSVIVRMVRDEDRRQGFDPRTVMRGLVADYKPLADLKFQLGVQDILTRRFSSEVAAISQIPKRNIGRTDFPEVPPDSLYLPVPIIYGHVSDENSYSTTIGTQPKFTWAAAPTRGHVGAAGTWNVKYVITLVGDETQAPPWDPANQQDERIVGTIEFADCVGPPAEDGTATGEWQKGTRYTYIEWDQPLNYATKIYGRFAKTEDAPSFLGGTFGFLGYIPRLATGGPSAKVRWAENWARSSQDDFQPPVNNMYYQGNFTVQGAIQVDNGKGVIPAIYVGPKRFV
jgi:hypothetical protein